MQESRRRGQDGPLIGHRVLELGSLVAGPFCGRLLADFGAEVVKVEQMDGDPVRFLGARVDGKSLYATTIMRNKKLVSVDLRTEDGQDIVRRLAATCDVVIENFRPGTLEGWGLGYDRLKEENPGLVMVRLSGFGQDGPYSQRPGYGIIGEAISGLRHMTGDPDRPPARVAIPLTDYIAGLYGAFGALMAIVHRQRTGRGQCVDMALYEAAFSFLEAEVITYDRLGIVPGRAGSGFPGHAPNNLFATADGQYIHVAAANQSLFRRLAGVMERQDLLEDARFATPLARAEHAAELDAIIAAWIGGQKLAEVETKLQQADVVAARIYTMADIFADPHFQARRMLEEVADEALGAVTLAGVVPKLSASPGAVAWSGGDVGRDTDDVLAGLLGLAPAEIERLEAAGAVSRGGNGAAGSVSAESA